MKTPLLITALLLACAGALPAQSTAAQPSAPSGGKLLSNPDADGIVTLPPGTLGAIVHGYIELVLMPQWVTSMATCQTS